MKTITKTTLVLLAIAIGIGIASVGNLNAEPLTGAVMDFQVSGKKLEDKGEESALLLNAYLSSSENLFLVERQELKKILGEQELGLTGTVSPGSASKIGSLVGAKVLITGRVFEVGSKLFIAAKVMSTETGRVFGETVNFEDVKGLDKGIETLAGKIDATVAKRANDLVAQVETPEERIARFEKLVPKGDKPTVSVSVEEQHIGRPVIDPAVETEMKMVFQKLGYEVIDDQSGKSADINISGEGFSEFAARFGNLVACRGRVEINVHRRSDSKLLLTSRHNASAADIAENVAGKRALEKAAMVLLEEIIPKIRLK